MVDSAEIYKDCTKFLMGHYPKHPQAMLKELVAETGHSEEKDYYGTGPLIEDFESHLSGLFGKEACVFMPSGTMAQQIALRIWCERKGTQQVGLHATSHLEIHEEKGLQFLHGLETVYLGEPTRIVTLADLENLKQKLSVVVQELPMREIGGQLPSWEELVKMSEWCRGQGVIFHMDGARLWEAGPFYQRPYAEIAGLFDSMYVSFYKGLGGVAGAALLGEKSFVAEARVWLRRHGGNLSSLYPYVLAARKGLRDRLEKMPAFCEKAKEVAQVLQSFPQIRCLPNIPQANMVHVFIEGDALELEARALRIAEEKKVVLFKKLRRTGVPGFSFFELSVGEATMDLSREEQKNLWEDFFALKF